MRAGDLDQMLKPGCEIRVPPRGCAATAEADVKEDLVCIELGGQFRRGQNGCGSFRAGCDRTGGRCIGVSFISNCFPGGIRTAAGSS
jgi:hypothetical protein